MELFKIDSLIELMENDAFKDPKTGNLFFPAYIYTYHPMQEHEMKIQIQRITERLERPNHFLQTLTLHLFEVLLEYLQSVTFLGETNLDYLLKIEKTNQQKANDFIFQEVQKEALIDFLAQKIKIHFGTPAADKKVYLLLYGVGEAYPYIRVSSLMKRLEKEIKHFKIIVFYPGTYENGNYNLFGKLNDDNIYRANTLNQML